MVLFEITQPLMRKLAKSSPFLDYSLSFWVQINPNGYSIVPNSLQRNHATFQWYIWPYLAHFLTDCHHFRFKWTSNDIALSQMVLHEITQPPVRKMAIFSSIFNWSLSSWVQIKPLWIQHCPKHSPKESRNLSRVKLARTSPFLDWSLLSWVQINPMWSRRTCDGERGAVCVLRLLATLLKDCSTSESESSL